MEYIVIWGLVSIVAAIGAAILAPIKRRDLSAWVAWCFILPPALIILALLPKNTGPLARRPSLDEDDYARD